MQILTTQMGGEADDIGIVEFIALFRQGGEMHRHHEVSQFKKVLGKWLYVNHQ